MLYTTSLTLNQKNQSMSSSNYSYTEDQTLPIPDASEMRFGIIVTEWNNNITDKLLDGAIEELKAMVWLNRI